MGLLFGTRSKEAEEAKILQMIQRGEVSTKTFLKHLNRRDRNLTDPHNTNIPDQINERTRELWDKVYRGKSKQFPLHIKVQNEEISLHGIESYGRLRALRSTNKKNVFLVQDK
ncbi:MAG: hypothetical protein KC535_05170 [Nanoarchaeota archaeon]|nr:hypothetical protein [Nanoarchaeota archaeon]